MGGGSVSLEKYLTSFERITKAGTKKPIDLSPQDRKNRVTLLVALREFTNPKTFYYQPFHS